MCNIACIPKLRILQQTKTFVNLSNGTRSFFGQPTCGLHAALPLPLASLVVEIAPAAPPFFHAAPAASLPLATRVPLLRSGRADHRVQAFDTTWSLLKVRDLVDPFRELDRVVQLGL